MFIRATIRDTKRDLKGYKNNVGTRLRNLSLYESYDIGVIGPGFRNQVPTLLELLSGSCEGLRV